MPSRAHLFAVDEVEVLFLNQLYLASLDQATNAIADANDEIISISNHGAKSNLLAIGLFSWTELNNGNDDSQPFLTNSQCARFMSAITSQSELKADLATELARVLPALASGITFIGLKNIDCGPKVAHEKRGDQHAVFKVNGMQISALYLYFAKDAAYVTFADPSVDRALQRDEATAPLGQSSVKAAVQDALRRVFLDTFREDYGKRLLELCFNSL